MVRWLVTLLILVAGLFFLMLALGAHLQLLDARRLMAEGRLAEGTVSETHSGGRRSTAYYFSYEYRAGAAAHAKKNSSISYGDYATLRAGRKIEVRYDPANPEKSITAPELAEHESWANRLFFPLLGLGLLAWGIARIFRRRPAPPTPPAVPANQVSPVRRGE